MARKGLDQRLNEFVKNNSAEGGVPQGDIPEVPDTNTTPTGVGNEPSKNIADRMKRFLSEQEPATPDTQAAPQESKKIEAPSAPEEPQKPEPKVGSSEYNLGQLRRMWQEAEEKAKRLETEFTEFKSKADVSKYEADLQRLQDEAKEYKEKYEKLKPIEEHVAVALTPEYTQKFVEQPKKIFEIMGATLDKYQLPQDLFAQALQIQSAVAQEEFIEKNVTSRRLRDQFYEAIDLLGQIATEKAEVDRRPGEFMTSLQMRRQQEIEEYSKNYQSSFEAAVDFGWNEALKANAKDKDNGLLELVELEGDSEHNEKVRKPILDDAKRVYDSLMGLFKMSGAPVKEDWALSISRLCQKGVVANSLAKDRNRWFKLYMEEREKREALEKKAYPRMDEPSSAGGGSSQPEVKGKNTRERLKSFVTQFE
jgi:hypothetical protein